MTVEINQEELYYNCNTLRENFNIEVPISGKILRTSRPTSDVRNVPESALRIAVQLWVFIIPPPLFAKDPAL